MTARTTPACQAWSPQTPGEVAPPADTQVPEPAGRNRRAKPEVKRRPAGAKRLVRAQNGSFCVGEARRHLQLRRAIGDHADAIALTDPVASSSADAVLISRK